MMLMDGKTADFRGPSRGSRADRSRRRPIPDGKNVERALVRFARTERYRREPEARILGTNRPRTETRQSASVRPPLQTILRGALIVAKKRAMSRWAALEATQRTLAEAREIGRQHRVWTAARR